MIVTATEVRLDAMCMVRYSFSGMSLQALRVEHQVDPSQMTSDYDTLYLV